MSSGRHEDLHRSRFALRLTFLNSLTFEFIDLRRQAAASAMPVVIVCFDTAAGGPAGPETHHHYYSARIPGTGQLCLARPAVLKGFCSVGAAAEWDLLLSTTS